MLHRVVMQVTVGALFVLVGCGGGGRSSLPLSQDNATHGSSNTSPFAFVGSAGKKQIGRYVWVWRTAKLDYDYGSVEVDCPRNYLVVGGGYHMSDRFLSEGATINPSKPNDTFTGWIVIGVTHDVRTRGTAYAACAPIK